MKRKQNNKGCSGVEERDLRLHANAPAGRAVGMGDCRRIPRALRTGDPARAAGPDRLDHRDLGYPEEHGHGKPEAWNGAGHLRSYRRGARHSGAGAGPVRLHVRGVGADARAWRAGPGGGATPVTAGSDERVTGRIARFTETKARPPGDSLVASLRTAGSSPM